MLTATEAASFLRLSPEDFSRAVQAGIVPRDSCGSFALSDLLDLRSVDLTPRIRAAKLPQAPTPRGLAPVVRRMAERFDDEPTSEITRVVQADEYGLPLRVEKTLRFSDGSTRIKVTTITERDSRRHPLRVLSFWKVP